MTETVFADGISDIMIINGAVRIEFFAFAPERAEPGKPLDASNMRRTRAASLVMPLAGFAGSLKVIEDVKQKLLAEGVIKATSEQPAAPAGMSERKSPNFS